MQVAILDDWEDAAARFLAWNDLPASVDVTVFRDHVPDEQELVERLRPFDAVMVMRERTPLPAEVLTRLPNLRLLVSSGGRNASIDMDAATQQGVAVCSVPSPRMSDSVAELTFGLMLSLARGIPQQERGLRSGEWGGTVGISLSGKTIGLLGLGKIGGRVASIAQVFGMRVLAWSERLTDERAEEAGARRVGLEECVRESDFVSIHLRLSDRTKGLLGASLLGLMKPTAYLVNTSRAPIIDTSALADALAERRIAGAALDVFETEPIPTDDPLLALDSGTVLTPHVGYVLDTTYEDFFTGYGEILRAWVEGSPIDALNPEALSRGPGDVRDGDEDRE
ncbi:MAG: D-2-hydroxyacid dehydrogenase family protein [Propionibacteriales bacterium]|nr:D-2-hydroxyacid dehydrogenase family protein [Propionibacteriales bacterium]